MKNLHLYAMDSFYCDSNVHELNRIFQKDDNLFVFKNNRAICDEVENCIYSPESFTPEYINDQHSKYKHIVLHSLFFTDDEILRITDEAAKRIIWCVWGHDLYTVRKKQPKTMKSHFYGTIHFAKMVVRGTHIKVHKKRKLVARKINLFSKIAIAYDYDRVELKRKYGKSIDKIVSFAPYSTKHACSELQKYKDYTKKDKSENEEINVLIGHSGYDFLEHEKYLDKLSIYKNENIHIFMILCYGADEKKIAFLREKAIRIYGKDKVTVITKMMPFNDYHKLLSNMDVAIFPFKHQSALGNVKFLAYTGCKLYFNPKGVLAKGFNAAGIKTFNCNKIGKIPYKQLVYYSLINRTSSNLFDSFDYDKVVRGWKHMLAN